MGICMEQQAVANGHCGRAKRAQKASLPWMIFVMLGGSLSPLPSFQLEISAEVVPAIISAMRSETRSAAAIKAASNLVI